MKHLLLLLIVLGLVSALGSSSRYHKFAKARHAHRHRHGRKEDPPKEEAKDGEAPAEGEAKDGEAPAEGAEGAAPKDAGPGEQVANGIEITISAPPLKRCTQSIGTKGKTIIDKHNYCKQGPGDILMNFYNVNLFGDMAKPESLKESIEWGYVEFPIKTISHLPNCVHIKAPKVNKEIFFCFEDETLIQPWMDAVQAYRFCKQGMDPEELAKLQAEAMAECMAEFTKKMLGGGAGAGGEGEDDKVDKEKLPSMGDAPAPEAKGAVKKQCKGCKARRRLLRI